MITTLARKIHNFYLILKLAFNLWPSIIVIPDPTDKPRRVKNKTEEIKIPNINVPHRVSGRDVPDVIKIPNINVPASSAKLQKLEQADFVPYGKQRTSKKVGKIARTINRAISIKHTIEMENRFRSIPLNIGTDLDFLSDLSVASQLIGSANDKTRNHRKQKHIDTLKALINSPVLQFYYRRFDVARAKIQSLFPGLTTETYFHYDTLFLRPNFSLNLSISNFNDFCITLTHSIHIEKYESHDYGFHCLIETLDALPLPNPDFDNFLAQENMLYNSNQKGKKYHLSDATSLMRAYAHAYEQLLAKLTENIETIDYIAYKKTRPMPGPVEEGWDETTLYCSKRYQFRKLTNQIERTLPESTNEEEDTPVFKI